MQNRWFFDGQDNSEPLQLAVPTQINFHAATESKSVYLSAYCDPAEPIIDLIEATVQRVGGLSVIQSRRVDNGFPQIFIGAQIPGLNSSDLWTIRTVVRRHGGMVETTRINYHVRQPVYPVYSAPDTCHGCQYYYGQAFGGIQLICAMHPYGPDNDACLDRSAIAPG
ncbi:MAG: hypothetical protein ACFE0J_08445 [Elainellaceae cyanobacterium]